MGNSVAAAALSAAHPDREAVPASRRHALLVRLTHWTTALCFFALLLSGVEILLSHPRFYWGETGDDWSKALFQLPVPSSRDMVPTRYHFVLPDQNGWSRYLHFEAAWLLVFTGLVYVAWGLWSGHFRRNLWPAASRAGWAAALRDHLRFRKPSEAGAHSYNPLQRLAYLVVIFGLVPLVVWTGLAMSLSFDAAFPWAVELLGGQQSARTLHFFDSMALTLFVVFHLVMVVQAGFLRRTRAMITGRAKGKEAA